MYNSVRLADCNPPFLSRDPAHALDAFLSRLYAHLPQHFLLFHIGYLESARHSPRIRCESLSPSHAYFLCLPRNSHNGCPCSMHSTESQRMSLLDALCHSTTHVLHEFNVEAKTKAFRASYAKLLLSFLDTLIRMHNAALADYGINVCLHQLNSCVLTLISPVSSPVINFILILMWQKRGWDALRSWGNIVPKAFIPYYTT